jgi:phycobilisome rod-core linker protein
MTLPLLAYKPSSQNHRVAGYEVGNDDSPAIYRAEAITDASSKAELIWAAYRQVFSEHVILASNRQTFLESQFNNSMISVRDFLRGLGKSETFYRLVVESNSNYRIVEICLKRFLGRSPYNEQEKIAWSIVIAQKGIGGFVDTLLDSEEYLQSFGDSVVPFQRRRMKERPFNLVTPRYSDYWRDREARDNPKQGDIRNFMDLARQLDLPQQIIQQKVNLTNITIPDMTRKSTDPVPASVRGGFKFPLR